MLCIEVELAGPVSLVLLLPFRKVFGALGLVEARRLREASAPDVECSGGPLSTLRGNLWVRGSRPHECGIRVDSGLDVNLLEAAPVLGLRWPGARGGFLDLRIALAQQPVVVRSRWYRWSLSAIDVPNK